MSTVTEVERFVEQARKCLSPSILSRPGATLYSAASTISPGDVYIVGVNPGGNPDEIKETVGDSFDSLPSKTSNAYTTPDWTSNGAFAPLQVRLQALTKSLGVDVQKVCAANQVFTRSRDMSGINFWNDAEACWGVHELLLQTVKPKLVIAFGNSTDSPFEFLKKKLAPNESVDRIPAGHANWECRGFRVVSDAARTYVAGFPHLSRYSPLDADGSVKSGVAKWMQDGLAWARGH